MNAEEEILNSIQTEILGLQNYADALDLLYDSELFMQQELKKHGQKRKSK